MSRIVHPQESSEKDVEHGYMLVLAFHSQSSRHVRSLVDGGDHTHSTAFIVIALVVVNRLSLFSLLLFRY